VVLGEKIREDLFRAVKQQDKTRVSTLRLLLSKIKNAEIAQGKAVDDSKIIDILGGEANQRRESIDAFKRGNRADLVAKEESELAIILEYLPKQMSREEIVAVARQVIDMVEAKAAKDKGKVMSQLMPQLKGKAGGKEVSEIVSELLAEV
jgi:hypothetical protein